MPETPEASDPERDPRQTWQAPILWLGGVGWEGTASTEMRLIDALSQLRRVAWFAPPTATAWAGWASWRAPAIQDDGGLTKVRVPGTRAAMRWPVRPVTSLLRTVTVSRLTRRVGATAVVVASPVIPLPRSRRVPRILYLTDDWVGGARFMGYSRRLIMRTLALNAGRADAIVGVSEPLVRQASRLAHSTGSRPVRAVIPNGAPPPLVRAPSLRRPIAVLLGQVNERIDLALLEATVGAGIPLRIVGPRQEASRSFGWRLQRLIEHPAVEWVGEVAPERVPDLLADATVGLTPYEDTPFNRSSSPLKTFDYLAAGLPVVSSDLPASRWIDSVHVDIGATPELFAAAVGRALSRPDSEAAREDRRRLAAAHSWGHRAAAFDRVIVQAVHRPDTGGRTRR